MLRPSHIGRAASYGRERHQRNPDLEPAHAPGSRGTSKPPYGSGSSLPPTAFQLIWPVAATTASRQERDSNDTDAG
jgi:hypothetical protein